MCSELSLIRVDTPTKLRNVQRQQKQTAQAALADLLATTTLLEKALDCELDDETHALVNAAYFQANQVKTAFDQMMTQIDSLQLEDHSRE